jgi:hypothetical protein
MQLSRLSYSLSPVAWLLATVLSAINLFPCAAAEPKFSPDQFAFFEREVKPILKANCVNCHGGEKKVQSGLHVTSREGLLKGGESGPAISLEEPAASEFLAAIRYESFEMPPKGKLPQAQIDVLTRWVEMGLPWPEGEAGNLIQHGPPVVDDAARNFWAFKPVVRPAVPAVKDTGWVRTPLDAFILAKLEARGLQPAPLADKSTLLRRVHYAVTGLPPTPAQVAAFLADESPEAYENVVAELLDSRHYGEHWGRHWLDLVRYAESNSFERDNPKPFVWRYRDYVIRSLNDDKPYGQFIREQLAGDELDDVTADSIIATGYYRLGLWDDEPADPLLAYFDGLDDIVATTGQTLLGLTINCARCHDHKIDPIPQSDYYKMVAFFRGIRHYGQRSDESVAAASLRSIATPEQQSAHQEQLAAHAQQIAELDRELGEIETSVADKLPGGQRDDFKYPRNRVSILRKHIGGLVTRETFDRYAQLRRQRERLDRQRPRAGELALAVTEDRQVPETFVLLRGNPQSHGDRVEPGFLAVMTAAGAASPTIEPPPADRGSSGRRRVLADWIADPANPLTTRVMANRVFQYHFGRGIVRSSSNFGYMGTPPTHPELLDWLAAEFAESGMRLKHLHRLILTSSAFRMSGQIDPEAAMIDPENDLLSHFDLRRLSAEEVRDSILAACGNLYLDKQDGPSVYPVIPQEVLAGQSQPGRNWERSTPEEAAARSVYVHVKRSLAVPILAAFDAPDPDAPCPVRFSTTQPTQALGMLNSQFLNDQAQVFAEQTLNDAGTEPTAQATFVLRRVLQREPRLAEVERGVAFMNRVQTEDGSKPEEALRQFCLLALNLNEFVYLE